MHKTSPTPTSFADVLVRLSLQAHQLLHKPRPIEYCGAVNLSLLLTPAPMVASQQTLSFAGVRGPVPASGARRRRLARDRPLPTYILGVVVASFAVSCAGEFARGARQDRPPLVGRDPCSGSSAASAGSSTSTWRTPERTAHAGRLVYPGHSELFVSDPAVIEHVLKTSFSKYSKDGKMADEDDVLPNGYRVIKGDGINYMIYAMGRMTDIWGDDAEEFRPERWLVNGVFQQESPYKFVSFNAGPRMCLGKEFAYRQMKIIAATLIRFFRFKLADESKDATYKTMFTLHIDNGLHLCAYTRSA